MAYRQRWSDYFSALDADGGGTIDPNDLGYASKTFAKMLGKPEDSAEVKKAVADYSEFFKHLISALDVNKDGSLSKDELLAGAEKFFVGKTAETVPDWWKWQVDLYFKVSDADGSGELDVGEVTTLIKHLNPAASDAEIQAAYNWALAQGTGKYNVGTLSKVAFIWATDPNPTPEASLLLPYFQKH